MEAERAAEAATMPREGSAELAGEDNGAYDFTG